MARATPIFLYSSVPKPSTVATIVTTNNNHVDTDGIFKFNFSGLHSHHGDVGWVPDGGADDVDDESSLDLARERHVADVGPLLLEEVVDPHASGGVEHLAEDGG